VKPALKFRLEKSAQKPHVRGLRSLRAATLRPKRRLTITISQGDSIHHPQHGIGTVQSIRERSFSGPDKSKFAKLFFPRDDMILMIRENDLEETIRKPILESEARKVLQHIGSWEESESEQWKVRANAQQNKLDAGNPFALAEVYKTLSLRMKAETMSAADRRQLSQSEQCLSEELAAALQQPLDKICRKMEKAALGR
jgi:RNA polymerase-interacting CarD/CdnL/TRCF family regulator